jgi:hypothetical protein
MKIPSLKEAKQMLETGERQNPGPWVQHSVVAAECAKAIAAVHGGLDSEAAYILGLLHDIGRIRGVYDCRHTLDGYEYLMDRHYPDAARICLTHSFPHQDIRCFSGKMDITPAQEDFLRDYIQKAAYDEYDRLIQLCDALAYPNGPCYIEMRLVNVALRKGVNNYTVANWKAFMGLKERFDKAVNGDIYSVIGLKV